MDEINSETASQTPAFVPKNEPSYMRSIMEQIGASLGLLKVGGSADLNAIAIEKAEEIDTILEDLATVRKEFEECADSD